MFHFIAQTCTVSPSFGATDFLARQAAEERAERSNHYHYILADEHRSWALLLAANAKLVADSLWLTPQVLKQLDDRDLRPAQNRGHDLWGY